MAQQNKDTNELIKVRRQKLADLQAAGKNPFEIMKYDVTHHSKEIKDNFEELEGKEVAVAGRLMFKRVMGKASFCNVQDLQGGIQAYVARDEIGVESYQDFKKMDIGDIVGVKGYPFVTKTGEKSIHATEVTLLSKSLQILPEKHHGCLWRHRAHGRRQNLRDIYRNAGRKHDKRPLEKSGGKCIEKSVMVLCQ